MLAEKIRSFTEEASIEDLMEKVGQLLDESIATKGYVIHATETSSLIDLSQIDFDALKAHFEAAHRGWKLMFGPFGNSTSGKHGWPRVAVDGHLGR